MSVDLVDAVLLLAPGFLALKVFYLFGAQRSRSQWEWTTWSVIVSVPIVGFASFLRSIPVLPLRPAEPDGVEVSLRLLVAVAVGAIASFAWRRIRASPGRLSNALRMSVNDSAWDQALEDASVAHRALVLVLDDDGKEYRGSLRYGDREDNDADGWLYLAEPEVRDATSGKFRPVNATHGILVHRDQVRRIRVLEARAPDNEEGFRGHR